MREGGGEGEGEDPGKHWWPSQPGKPGVQLHASYDGPLLVHHGDDGDAQVLTRMEKTQRER